MNQPVNAAASPYPNYLAWSIIVTILGACLCCLVGAVPGVVAIVYGTQINTKLAAGDDAGARKASETAKLWCWIGTGVVILGLLLQVASFFLNGAAMFNEDFLRQMQQAQGG
jgi:hypothetical protein